MGRNRSTSGRAKTQKGSSTKLKIDACWPFGDNFSIPIWLTDHEKFAHDREPEIRYNFSQGEKKMRDCSAGLRVLLLCACVVALTTTVASGRDIEYLTINSVNHCCLNTALTTTLEQGVSTVTYESGAWLNHVPSGAYLGYVRREVPELDLVFALGTDPEPDRLEGLDLDIHQCRQRRMNRSAGVAAKWRRNGADRPFGTGLGSASFDVDRTIW